MANAKLNLTDPDVSPETVDTMFYVGLYTAVSQLTLTLPLSLTLTVTLTLTLALNLTLNPNAKP